MRAVREVNGGAASTPRSVGSSFPISTPPGVGPSGPKHLIMRMNVLLAALASTALLVGAPSLRAQAHDASRYWVYVANESSDVVSVVRFDGHQAVEETAIPVGYHPTDIDGAHGVSVSPDGEYLYVSLAHGQPYGRILKMRTGTNQVVDSMTAGLFPSSMALTPDGSTLFASNFNLHGDPVPSMVSAVFTPLMAQVERIETCVRPHGSRVSHDGANHYSGCLLSDQLVEISTQSLAVTRRMSLTAEHEGLTEQGPSSVVDGAEACRPSWVVLSPDDRWLYVTCNGRGEVLEIERETLWIKRRFATGLGPYNADITPDGSRLLVTLKGEQALAVIDLKTGAQLRLQTSRPVTHGVVVSPDGRYAFVSNEAVGATRGTVDVIDLATTRIVATAEVQFQAGGIAFWKSESSAP
ncbi:MAG: beta-propeller fold lactonase family protein [Gemmatimonadota bacterium]|nr:beta-propeller fold lactonase family protein [Gemmatimonadota bacterium]